MSNEDFRESFPEPLVHHWTEEELINRLRKVEPAAEAAIVAILKALQSDEIPLRSPVARTLLNLVDSLRPDAQDDGEWLPESIIGKIDRSDEDLRFAQDALYFLNQIRRELN